MATIAFPTIAAPVAVATGTAASVGGCQHFAASLEGTFVGTYQLQISLDPSSTPAAASWLNAGTALTAAGYVEVTAPCAWARWNCTAFTSGAPASHIAGVLRQ